jgi:signal transduction histidine kinase/iron only hydrogenase large subunit-like protein
MNSVPEGGIETIRERCRVCYTCVRECPAKAIRINEGQAEVLAERCIGCGNCVRVCSQGAKRVVSSLGRVEELLGRGGRTVALLAPSFPAEFTDCDERQLVGLVRALGFAGVYEVGFGADLVARRYRQLIDIGGTRPFIATTCPAVVLYIEKYYPHLVPSLAPVVSPMVAMARVVRRIHAAAPVGQVFIGPCIAKKSEAVDVLAADGVDAVMTFAELRELCARRGLAPAAVPPADFDPPRAGLGAIFPISRGLLQAAGVREDLMADEVVTSEGHADFTEAIKAFEAHALDARLLEVLACDGCIMGAGMTTQAPLFRRRSQVSRHVRVGLLAHDEEAWRGEMARYADLDLGRSFAAQDQRLPPPSEDDLAAVLAQMGKHETKDELNCGACGYATCREHATAILRGLAEDKMCLPYTIEQLRGMVEELAHSHRELVSTQEALMQSEKLASMGQLAAGVAHEVNNPLGVVLLYAHMLLKECEPGAGRRQDLTLIVEQADRCKKIVSGLLHFARQNKVLRQPVDLREVVARGLRSVTVPAAVAVTIRHQLADPVAELDADQMVQVITNLVSNACAAMPNGGTLAIETDDRPEAVRLHVGDTGQGIPPEVRPKVFDPFFTTKQIGQGTGLGLAVTYGIIKMHQGDITFTTNHNPAAGPTGTRFTVTLPRRGPSAS